MYTTRKRDVMKQKQDLGLRFVAYLIDSLVVSIIGSIFTFATIRPSFEFGFDIEFGVQYIDEIVFFAIYYIGFVFYNGGQTLGKLATNQKIVSYSGEPLERNKLLLREVMKVLFLPVAFVSFLFALFRDDNKTLHDLLVDTIVVVEKQPAKEPPKQPTSKPQSDDDDPFKDVYKTDRKDDYYE